MINIDEEMPANEIEMHIYTLTEIYRKVCVEHLRWMKKDNAKITHRKMNRFQKATAFKLLRLATK